MYVCFAEVCRRHVPLPVQAKQRRNALITGFQEPKNNNQLHQPRAAQKTQMQTILELTRRPRDL
jgi:hypothetical protein